MRRGNKYLGNRIRREEESRGVLESVKATNTNSKIGLTVEVFEIVLLSPDRVPDDEGVGAGEIGNGARIELAIFNRIWNFKIIAKPKVFYDLHTCENSGRVVLWVVGAESLP